MATSTHQAVIPTVLEEMYFSAKDLQGLAENVLLTVTTMDHGHDGKEYLFPVAAKCQAMAGSIQTQLLRWAELSASMFRLSPLIMYLSKDVQDGFYIAFRLNFCDEFC